MEVWVETDGAATSSDHRVDYKSVNLKLFLQYTWVWTSKWIKYFKYLGTFQAQEHDTWVLSGSKAICFIVLPKYEYEKKNKNMKLLHTDDNL